MITLKNNQLSISIKEHGAELASIRTAEREYLWQADPQYWARHSPVLFPIVGSVFDKHFRLNGQQLTIGQHGFARDCDFTLISLTDSEAWLALESNDDTRAKFPADFRLEIGYRLRDRHIDVMWRVVNTASHDTLHFHIGAHPAFNWPDHNPEEEPRGYFAFDTQATLTSRRLVGKGCVSPTETFDIETDSEGMYALSATTFDDIDTIILEGRQTHRVALCDLGRRPILALSFDAPVVGLWSPPGQRAPFVCIEPWYGRCDSYGYEGEFKDRDWCNHLAPGQTFDAHYTIEIC